MKIHPTAIVHPKAELADEGEIQAYTIIGPDVVIQDGTVVGPHCVIVGQTVIGKNNHIYSGAQIGILSQDLKHAPGLTGRTVIGDGNMIREHVTISASTMTGHDDEDRVTSIGHECMFMANSHVAHDCHVGNRVIMANCVSLSGHVDVEDKAILGGLSGVHQECVIGTMAFVGGMTRIVKDAAPYMIFEGNPARCYGPNTVGLRRNGFGLEQRQLVKTLYRIMYRSGLNTTQALHEIEATTADSPEREHFLGFFRKSLRGVTR